MWAALSVGTHYLWAALSATLFMGPSLTMRLPCGAVFIYHIFMRKIVLFLLCGCVAAAPVCGGVFPFSFGRESIRTDYSTTVWDKIMQDQSRTDMRRGLMEMGLSRYAEAQNSFAKAVIKNPKDPMAFLLLGAALYWSGKVDEAMSEYREALSLDPQNALAYQLLGIAYGWKGDVQQAHEYFMRSARLDPNKADTQMNLGSTYAVQKNWDSALDHLRRAVELAPREPLYHYQLGALYETLGRDAQAEESFKKALSLFVHYEDAMLSLGALYEKTNRPAQALKFYKKAVRTKPGDFVARLRLAKLLYEQNRPQDARDTLDGAFSIVRFKQDGLALNAVYRSNGRTAEAFQKEIANFSQNLSRVPANKEVQIEVAIQYTPLQQTPKTAPKNRSTRFEQAYEKIHAAGAIPNENTVLPMAFNRSFVLNAATPQEREEQIKTFVAGLQHAVAQGQNKYDISLSLQGRTQDYAAPYALTQENTSAPRAAYDPRIVGNDMGLWVTGKSWLVLVKSTVEDLSAADTPAGAETALLLGLAHLVAGNSAAAAEEFYKAQKEAPGDYLPLMGLGTAAVIAGDDKAAENFYLQALQLNPKNKTAKRNLRVLQEE